jgi:hypothetical protein
MSPRAGLDAMEKRKFWPCQESNPGRPDRDYTDRAIVAPKFYQFRINYIQCHCLRLDATQYILYYLSSLFLPHYMFRPYLAILRC